jgi:flagellar M-ring protein FliF
MNDYLKKVSGQISAFIGSLTPAKKLAVGFTSAVVVAGIAALFVWAGNTSYVPLMSNLNSEDSANIIRILRDKRIPFKVDVSGKNISIPSESVYDLRLELATMGLPQSSVVGYEVFDKQTLGTTSYVQKINQKRALEGELTRTISTIKGVKRARVHLALPQKSTFVEDQKKSTASVVVDLEPGTTLNEKQVYGIGNLVSRAVEGMETGDVVIVDSNGKTLSKTSNDPLSAATASQLDFQQKVETDLERRVEALLSRVVGEGRVVAKVTADLDFAQVNETQTTYDQDGSAIRSTEKRNDSAAGTRPAPGGVAGAQSNLPNADGNGAGGRPEIKTDTNKAQEFTNYEVPQTVRRTTKPSGGIKKLSVAVMVDGKTIKSTDKEGKVLSKVEAWGPEKLKEFEDVVASAVGIDKKRGDILEIRNMEFTHEDFEEVQRAIAEKERKAYVQNLILYGVIGITIGLFFFFVVRPFIKWVTENTIDSVDTFLPQTIEELERMQKNAALPGLEEVVPVLPEKIDPEKVEGDMLKEKIFTLVDANPHKAALILKDWLGEQKTIVGAEKPAKDGGKDKTA